MWNLVLIRPFTFAVAATLSISAILFGHAANASTFTSPLIIPFCVGCTTAGEVLVTDTGTGTLTFQVTLFDDHQFVGGVDAFAFNLKNSPTITFANFTPALFTGSNTSAAIFNLGGFGPFMYGVTAPGSGAEGQSFDFDVTANGGLTLSDVVIAADGQLFGNTFAVHVCSLSAAQCSSSDNNYAFTFIGGSRSADTPVPAALPLFATGLGALGLLGWRRKRKNAAAKSKHLI